MEKFEYFGYVHIDSETLLPEASAIVARMRDAEDFGSFEEAVLEFDSLQRRVETMRTICEIMHTLDTTDPYYAAEQDYFDSMMPDFEEVLTDFARAFVRADMREKTEEKWGKHTVTKCLYQIRSFDSCLIDLKKRENALMSSYQNIMASSEISFDGKKLTLPGLMKYFRDPDEDVRRRTMRAFGDFLHSMEKTLDPLFDEMVKVRTEMGKMMGFDDYIHLGYINMRRYDYDMEDVKRYRSQVREVIVPLTEEIRKKQAGRIGAEKPVFFNNWFEYPEGNPVPDGDAAELTLKAGKMYRQMSPETAELFDVMQEGELFDLESRPGKAQGGYCTSIPKYSVPFIFANFNGTTDDVETLTHEFGHALNSWFMRDTDLLIQQELTMETAEIHSTSMEFFSHPYMEMFFRDKESADRYRYSHLAGTLCAIAYECCVDEFQHEIYAKPDLTPDERKAVWHRLETEYMPGWDFEGDEDLERGLYWLRQLHIFECPFYYIDYSLATLTALELYGLSKTDREKAFAGYFELSRTGNLIPYRQVLKKASLSDPFTDGAIERIVTPLREELEL